MSKYQVDSTYIDGANPSFMILATPPKLPAMPCTEP